MLSFDMFSLMNMLKCRKLKSRPHGIRKKGNDKRKKYAAIKSLLTFYFLNRKFMIQFVFINNPRHRTNYVLFILQFQSPFVHLAIRGEV